MKVLFSALILAGIAMLVTGCASFRKPKTIGTLPKTLPFVVRKCDVPYSKLTPEIWQEKSNSDKLKTVHPYSEWRRANVDFSVMHDDDNVYIRFQSNDHFVQATHTKHNTMVCQDTCGEFFFSPFEGSLEYFNLEISITGAAWLAHHSADNKETMVHSSQFDQLEIRVTPNAGVIDPEVLNHKWTIEAKIPVALLNKYASRPIGKLSGQTWKANFYHCSDWSSHPRWNSWMPLPKGLTFHCPKFFGPITFE